MRLLPVPAALRRQGNEQTDHGVDLPSAHANRQLLDFLGPAGSKACALLALPPGSAE